LISSREALLSPWRRQSTEAEYYEMTLWTPWLQLHNHCLDIYHPGYISRLIFTSPARRAGGWSIFDTVSGYACPLYTLYSLAKDYTGSKFLVMIASTTALCLDYFWHISQREVYYYNRHSQLYIYSLLRRSVDTIVKGITFSDVVFISQRSGCSHGDSINDLSIFNQ
jgi:hypothetical protein